MRFAEDTVLLSEAAWHLQKTPQDLKAENLAVVLEIKRSISKVIQTKLKRHMLKRPLFHM